MNSLKTSEIELSGNRRHSPPPSVNPATPTPGMRPPTTFSPVGPSVAYTWSQVRPAPTSTVPHVEFTFVSLKRDIVICTPVVDENPGFVACPPPFTAKGVRVDPRIRNYKKWGSAEAGASDHVTLQSHSRPRQSLAPPSKSTPRHSREKSVQCQTSTQMSLNHPSDRVPGIRE